MNYFRYFSVIALAVMFANCSNAQSTQTAEGEVIVINKADFLAKIYNYEKNTQDWVYEGDKPCIVDFYADWCGPCKMVAPIMKELAAKYKDEIVFYKVDVDREQELAQVFGITSIPVILFVPKEGKPQGALGALPKDAIIAQIDKLLLTKD